MIVLLVLVQLFVCKPGRYGRRSLSRAVNSDSTALDKKSETLLKLRVSAAITELPLSYLKGRKEINHATTKTVFTQDEIAQRGSEQLDRVPYRDKGDYMNSGPLP